MEIKNIKLTLSYDGTRYHGWQRQKNGLSIQEVVETCLERITQTPVRLIASGRTDAGVHALNQVCNFVTRSTIPPESIKRALNSLLPDDIHVNSVDLVPQDFHSRYSAKSKIYEYRLWNHPEPDIFLRNRVWHLRLPLDIHAMSECLSLLVGTHDFSAFRSSGSNNTNPVRTVLATEIREPGEDGILRIIIEANGFLRHMVRNIVGTVVAVGQGRSGVNDFREILVSKDRRMAGIKAPAQGLFLVHVIYPEDA